MSYSDQSLSKFYDQHGQIQHDKNLPAWFKLQTFGQELADRKSD